MMNKVVGILDRDVHYVKAFMSAVALDHEGYSVRACPECGAGCAGDVDVCIRFDAEAAGGAAQQACGKAFAPACGRYAGVSAILREVRAFLLDRKAAGFGVAAGQGAPALGRAPFGTAALVCVYACAGGLGTSVGAIGIGRELARYRGGCVMYLSVEDAEDPGLFPEGVRAMRAEEALYRYLRAVKSGEAPEAFGRLFGSAAARDEYGLFRLAPDDGPNSMARLAPEELYVFLQRASAALALTRIVLDFGTRLHCLNAFAKVPEGREAIFVEVLPSGGGVRKHMPPIEAGWLSLASALPRCREDIRRLDDKTDVGLANTFGLAVKEICDKITGEAL